MGPGRRLGDLLYLLLTHGDVFALLFYLLPEQSFSMDASQFQIIYPSYLDGTKSVKQGRRIGKEVAVDRPTVSDISTALQSLQIRHVLQPHKGYSRDIETLWENPGRIKYDHLHANNTATSKRELLIELAKIIPTLPQRQQRLQEEEQERLLREQEEAEAQKAQQNQKLLLQQQQQPQTSSAAGAKSNKKKGKKKR